MNQATIDEMLFVGFNSRVVALHCETGELVWDWKAPSGSGFVALLVDGDCLFASIQGYTYCLDPLSGETLWSNPLKGYGMGIASLATVRGTSSGGAAAQDQVDAARRRSHSSS